MRIEMAEAYIIIIPVFTGQVSRKSWQILARVFAVPTNIKVMYYTKNMLKDLPFETESFVVRRFYKMAKSDY
jgi:hypothetical protein